MLLLMRPTEANEAEVMAYRSAFLEASETLHGTAGLADYEHYADWLRAVDANACEATARLGFVPSSTLLAVRRSDGRMVGMVDIRHRLNEYLKEIGGHIGYSVLPSERRRGYAREMLRLALGHCASLSIDRALVCCDARNEASRRTIRSCGGVLENRVTEEHRVMERYWLSLPYTVRPALPEDAAGIWRMNRAALSYDYPLDQTTARLAQLLSAGRDRLWVADKGGQVVGYIHAADYDCTYVDRQKNILALAVDPACQGQGIGHALLDAAEQWALEAGCAGVRLVSGFNRTGAHAFYLACGYTLRKDQKNFIKRF